MIRALLRLIVIVVILVAAAAFFLGYRITTSDAGLEIERPVGTSGTVPEVDTAKARETGAAIGERVASGANRAQRALADGALTAKIKSKMALDDTLEAARIDVDTVNGVVTLTGTVRRAAERERALQLARETDGVVSVTDRLAIR
jgi:osmotically-inducible protein OsmY